METRLRWASAVVIFGITFARLAMPPPTKKQCFNWQAGHTFGKATRAGDAGQVLVTGPRSIGLTEQVLAGTIPQGTG